MRIFLFLLCFVSSIQAQVTSRWISQQSSTETMPAYLTNCVYYFDKDISQVYDVGDMNVSDLSGVKENSYQVASANKPTFSMSTGLFFDNTNDFLTIPRKVLYGNNFTIYWRCNRSVAGDDRLLIGDNTNPLARFFLMMRSTLVYMQIGSGTTIQFTGLTNADLLGDHLYRLDNDGVNLHLYIDGVIKGAQATNSTFDGYANFTTIGSPDATQPLSGYLSQLMVFNNYLDSTATTIIENQLTNKSHVPHFILTPKIAVFQTGQSNADGRVSLSGFPSQNQTFTNASLSNILNSRFQAINATVGINDYRSFEIEYARLFNKGIYVFKFAYGASYLASKPTTNNWNVHSTGDNAIWLKTKIHFLYFKHLLKSTGINPVFCASIRMQGEEDAFNQTDADAFNVNLTELIAEIKTLIPGVPHIEMLIHTSSRPYCSTVRAAQSAVVAAVPGCYSIDTENYNMQGDNIHYSAAGCITGGNDIYNFILSHSFL